MIVESCQLLANCYTLQELEYAPKTQSGNIRKYSYYNHKCSVWTSNSLSNFNWLLSHATYLLEERKFRYNKDHFCSAIIKWYHQNQPDLSDDGFTSPALAIKDYPDLGDYITTYRNYYNQDKRTMFNWGNRNVPYWICLD